MAQQVVVEQPQSNIKWSGFKIVATFLMYAASITCIGLGIYPFIDGFIDAKAFANLVFVAFHIFYMFSFLAVKKNSQFFFWILSYFMLNSMTFLFLFYEELLF